MPASVHRPKVARCVQHVVDGGKDKGSAIPICQASIGESYRIGKAERAVAKKGGKPLKQLRKQQAQTKAAKIQARREKMGWNVAGLIETLNANPEGCNQYGCKGGGAVKYGQVVTDAKGKKWTIDATPRAGDKTVVVRDERGSANRRSISELTVVEGETANPDATRRAKSGKNFIGRKSKTMPYTKNGFCPTGQGGGRDNSCHGAGGKLNSKADQQRRKLRRMFEQAKAEVSRSSVGNLEAKLIGQANAQLSMALRDLSSNELVAILNGDDEVQTSIAKVSAGAVGGTTALLEHCKKSAKRRKRR